MASFTPQQQEAISTLDRNVSVSAGAGSGKTRVLVERFLKILQERKATAQEILAITFTRKAAREMQERVRKGILERLTETLDPEEKAYWQEQLQLADRAPITTIDSFCSQVLRENPVEAGLDPDFAVREEYQIRAFREETAQAFIQKEIQQQAGDVAALLDLYPADRLAGILTALIDDLPAILALPGGLAAPYEASLAGEEEGKIAAEGALDVLLEARDQAGPKGREKLEVLAGQREEIHQWIAEGCYDRAAAALKPVSAAGTGSRCCPWMPWGRSRPGTGKPSLAGSARPCWIRRKPKKCTVSGTCPPRQWTFWKNGPMYCSGTRAGSSM
mgnify:CR=1 FL=1